MSGKPEGSYPRRLIKRTHNRNPTFHSFNLFGVLQPDASSPSSPTPPAVRTPYSLNTLVGGTVSTHQKAFLDSYLPDRHDHYLAERGERSITKGERVQKGVTTPRSKSTAKIEMDSLHQAEDDFLKNKLRNPQYFISGGNFKGEDKARSRVVLDLTPRPQKEYSVKRCQSIMEKQKIDYDIISNMAHG